MDAKRLLNEITKASNNPKYHDGKYGVSFDSVQNADDEVVQKLVQELVPFIIRLQQAEIERLQNLSSKDVYDLTVMQQEIERLNRAYEVLWEYVVWSFGRDGYIKAEIAMEDAQLIREGKEGEQG